MMSALVDRLMVQRRRVPLASVVLVIVALLTGFGSPAAAQSGGPYQIVQGTISGGAATSSGGAYSLVGTVDLGTAGKSMSAPRFCVDGGAWSGLLPPGGCAGFYPVTPCRVYDSRVAGGPLVSGTTRVVPTVATACGLPAWAHSVALNLTAVAASGIGVFTLFPAGNPLPSTTTLDFRAGQTRANNAVMRLGPAGELAVRTTIPGAPGGTVHLVVDVTGYFVGTGY